MMKEVNYDTLMQQLLGAFLENPDSVNARNLFEQVRHTLHIQQDRITELIILRGSCEEQISQLAKYVEKLEKREAEMDQKIKQMEEKQSQSFIDPVSTSITADDIIKSFVERLGTLQERVESKRVMADIFGESGAWVEARNKLTESGYFREEHPHLPISYKGNKLVELKFFDRTMYVTVEEQQQLKLLLKNAAGMIDTQEDSSWFCIYAAYRYVKGKLGTKGAYTDFFSDVEALLPDVLTKINPAESGDKRYSPYTQMLGRVVSKWFVDDGKLPPLNNLLFSNVRCTKEQFDSYSLIIKNLWRDFKKLEDKIKQEKQAEQ